MAAALVGAMAGVGRRQSQERAAQAALIRSARPGPRPKRARAELLAGRNHLARELHDVLAHTLSALSLQLEALDALIGAGPALAPEVRGQLDGIKRLVREGLDEARGAVRALREGRPAAGGAAGPPGRRPPRRDTGLRERPGRCLPTSRWPCTASPRRR